jgi:hypothetical protein
MSTTALPFFARHGVAIQRKPEVSPFWETAIFSLAITFVLAAISEPDSSYWLLPTAWFSFLLVVRKSLLSLNLAGEARTVTLVCWAFVSGYMGWVRYTNTVNQTNVAHIVQGWADTLHDRFADTIERRSVAADLFTIVVTPKGELPVLIGQRKSVPEYLAFVMDVSLPDLGTTTVAQKDVDRLHAQLIRELARLGVTYKNPDNFKHIQLEKDVLINSDLTETVFVQQIDAIGGAAIVVTNMYRAEGF